MTVICILLSLACLLLLVLLLRLYAAIRFVCRQLETIQEGSHIQLTVTTRQRPLLTLCRILNRILSSRDRTQIQYEQAQKQLKQNITNLAHDIRTPLTGASGYLQLARECHDAAKNDHYLASAGRRLNELEDMLEKLFLYTKLTNEAYVFPEENKLSIQLLPLLSECLLSLYTDFEEKKILPEIHFRQEGFRVRADEDSLRRIFLNLIQNALLHGSGGLRILQSSGEAPAHCPLRSTARSRTISPAGCLIFENPFPKSRPMDISQIFDRFYKADPARGRASSGLGLFIVRELMRKLGGEAMAETAAEHGGVLLGRNREKLSGILVYGLEELEESAAYRAEIRDLFLKEPVSEEEAKYICRNVISSLTCPNSTLRRCTK